MPVLATRFHLSTVDSRAVVSKGKTTGQRPRLPAFRGSVTMRFAFSLFFTSSCGRDDTVRPTGAEEEQRIKAELENRSFRQFDPSRDASPRKGVVLDFFRGVHLWAQYARDGRAVNEWEIGAPDYRIEKGRNFKFSNPEYIIYFDQPSSAQEFPSRCDNCIQSEGFTISVRNVFDSEKITFKLNDSGNSLPPPFPVFGSWTRFMEDEYFE